MSVIEQPVTTGRVENIYDAQRNIFDEIRGVWITDKTLSRVFDLSSQSKHKLRSKRRSNIVIYAKTRGCDFLCFNLMSY